MTEDRTGTFVAVVERPGALRRSEAQLLGDTLATILNAARFGWYPGSPEPDPYSPEITEVDAMRFRWLVDVWGRRWGWEDFGFYLDESTLPPPDPRMLPGYVKME